MSETCKIKGRKILGQQKQGKKEKKRKIAQVCLIRMMEK